MLLFKTIIHKMLYTNTISNFTTQLLDLLNYLRNLRGVYKIKKKYIERIKHLKIKYFE